MIRIADGIPLPPTSRGVRRLAPIVMLPSRPRPAQFSGLTDALMRMRAGQSLLLQGVASGRAHAMLRHAVRRGRLFAVRQGKRGTRVWFVGSMLGSILVLAGDPVVQYSGRQ